MPEPEPATPAALDSFISRWSKSGGHERGSGQLFLSELCSLLELPAPDPPQDDTALNAYVFERRVDRKKPDGTTVANFIDLYKAGCFVLETKQGVNARRDKADPDQPLLTLPENAPAPKAAGHGTRGTAAFDKALERAWQQATRYIHALPVAEGRPPFLIVCDVGHSIDLYAEFSGTGGQYERFPDPISHRLHLRDIHRPEIRERLRRIWADPHSLDPARHAAAVTREVAAALAGLAKSLERDGHDPQVTAGFLQRCLFTMFAEDIGLLPENSFCELLTVAEKSPAGLPVLLQGLWADMAAGAVFSPAIRAAIPHFNGGLFDTTSALPLRPDQIAFLLHAARSDWSAVEPAIFGTLLERALDPRERHKLGAHYTPRSYVERLVRPALIEPLREEWEAVKTAAAQLDEKGDAKAARAAIAEYHHRLCRLRILDPACGSGNFLYVCLELLKRLEAEVLDLLEKLGGDRSLEMDTFKVRPDQFLGLEVNARAVAIAQLVLWIGYFQWHRKTAGRADTGDRPLLPKKATIRQQDAVLAYDEKVPRRDPATGEIVTIWDGRTTKPHPVTGKEVPDETARTVLYDYLNPRRAEWPEADYIVGNPPFIGTKRMIDALGEGYTTTLRRVWKTDVPDSADFVMYWWRMAAEKVVEGKCRAFGFITTNSIHQTFNRRVIEPFVSDAKTPLHLAYAIPDHPWVDSADGAAVRIAMTIAAEGSGAGVLEKVTSEIAQEDGENIVTLSRSGGHLGPNLQIGADLSSVEALESNSKIAGMGVALHGSGFILSPEHAADFRQPGSTTIRPYLGGADLLRTPRERYLIDFSFTSESEARESNPAAFQHVVNHVKPERDQNRRDALRLNWWKFGWERPVLRKALADLQRYVGTTETSKHRVFQFIPVETLADHMIVCVASDDAATLGILSSTPHVRWSMAAGGRLGMGNDPRYNKSRCFDPFPFPALDETPLTARIRDFGERLDAHRKRQQQAHPELTVTGIYNVLEKLRRREPLAEKDRKIHDQGLVTLLKQIHDDLDAATLEAYGWTDLADPARPLADRLAVGDEPAEALEQQILTRLVALNHERAAEEERGQIRWLRPAFQSPEAAPALPAARQQEIELEASVTAASKSDPSAVSTTWPDTLSAQVAAIQKLLPAHGSDPAALAAAFGKKSKARVTQIGEILETLRSLGKL